MAQTTEDHDHSEYEVTSGLLCDRCSEPEAVCAMCGVSLHKCAQLERKDPRLIKGFKKIPDYPDYMVNNQAAVRHIPTGKLCSLLRVSSTGAAMINVVDVNGTKVIVAAQDLRDMMFNR